MQNVVFKHTHLMRWAFVACIISASALFVQSCKQPQPVQTVAPTIPLNTIPYDGVSLSSMGAATLTQSGSSITVSPMNSGSDGVSTDFTNKTEWLQYGRVPSFNIGDTMQARALDDSVISTLTMKAVNDTTVSLLPVFTSQTKYVYSVILHNGATEVDSVGGLTSSSNPTLFCVNAVPSRTFQKHATPQYCVFTKDGVLIFTSDNLTEPACDWRYHDSVAHVVTDPNGSAFNATQVDMLETVSGGSYSYPTFNHIQEVGNCDSLIIDSVYVN